MWLNAEFIDGDEYMYKNCTCVLWSQAKQRVERFYCDLALFSGWMKYCVIGSTLGVFRTHAKPRQVRSSRQANLSHPKPRSIVLCGLTDYISKPSQAKPSRTKPTQVKSSHPMPYQDQSFYCGLADWISKPLQAGSCLAGLPRQARVTVDTELFMYANKGPETSQSESMAVLHTVFALM